MSSVIYQRFEAVVAALRAVPGLHVYLDPPAEPSPDNPPIAPAVQLSRYSVEAEDYGDRIHCTVVAEWQLRAATDVGADVLGELELMEACMIAIDADLCDVRVNAATTEPREPGSNYMRPVIETSFNAFIERD